MANTTAEMLARIRSALQEKPIMTNIPSTDVEDEQSDFVYEDFSTESFDSTITSSDPHTENVMRMQSQFASDAYKTDETSASEEEWVDDFNIKSYEESNHADNVSDLNDEDTSIGTFEIHDEELNDEEELHFDESLFEQDSAAANDFDSDNSWQSVSDSANIMSNFSNHIASEILKNPQFSETLYHAFCHRMLNDRAMLGDLLDAFQRLHEEETQQLAA